MGLAVYQVSRQAVATCLHEMDPEGCDRIEGEGEGGSLREVLTLIQDQTTVGKLMGMIN